jgi:hypothetical protein
MGKSSGGGGSMPQPTDPATAIRAQSAANKEAVIESAKVNAVDVYGPFGSSTYQKNADGTPKSQTTTLSAPNQYIYDKQLAIGANLADTADNRTQGLVQTPFSLNGFAYDPAGENASAMPKYSGYTTQQQQFAGGVAGNNSQWSFGVPANSQDTVNNYQANPQQWKDNVGDAIYNQGVRRMSDQWSQQGSDLNQDMANRGIAVGSEAWNRATGNLSRTQNDARANLADQAMTQSGAEAQRTLTMGMGADAQEYSQGVNAFQANMGADAQRYGQQSQTFGTNVSADTQYQSNLMGVANQQQKDYLTGLQTRQQLRQQGITESLTERNQSINEASAIMQGSPAIGMPQAPNVPTYQMQAVNAQGAYNDSFNQQMATYKQNQQQQSSMWNGALGMASAALPMMFSNSSFKTIHGDA